MAWLGVVIVLAPATLIAETDALRQGLNGPLVAVMFDDGWLDQYQNALPILLEYDIPATFAIQVESIGRDRRTRAARMNLAELRELSNLGMEFASQSMTHPNLTEVDSRKLRRELEVSRAKLRRTGLKPILFAYPYGAWNDTVAEYVEKAGYAGARTLDLVYTNLSDLNGTGRYWIGGWSITDESAEDIKYIVDSVEPGQLVVLVYHHVSDDGPRGSTNSVQAFRSHMSLLRDEGYDVVSLWELLPQEEDYYLGEFPLVVTAVAAVSGAALAIDAIRRRSSG